MMGSIKISSKTPHLCLPPSLSSTIVIQSHSQLILYHNIDAEKYPLAKRVLN